MKSRGQRNASGRLFEIDARLVPMTQGGGGGPTPTGGSGEGTLDVSFGTTFERVPHVAVVPHEADEAAGATYTATNVTKTGFTIVVSGSYFTTGKLLVHYFASEKS